MFPAQFDAMGRTIQAKRQHTASKPNTHCLQSQARTYTIYQGRITEEQDSYNGRFVVFDKTEVPFYDPESHPFGTSRQ